MSQSFNVIPGKRFANPLVKPWSNAWPTYDQILVRPLVNPLANPLVKPWSNPCVLELCSNPCSNPLHHRYPPSNPSARQLLLSPHPYPSSITHWGAEFDLKKAAQTRWGLSWGDKAKGKDKLSDKVGFWGPFQCDLWSASLVLCCFALGHGSSSFPACQINSLPGSASW